MWSSSKSQRHGPRGESIHASSSSCVPASPPTFHVDNPVYERCVGHNRHRTFTLPIAQTMHAGQPDSAPSAAQGDILLLSHYAEPNPAVAAEPALTRRPTVFQRPSEHLQLQQHATGERDFRTRDERSLSRVLQLVSGGESSTEVTTVLQTNVNLPGTNATAMTSNDNYETHDSTVTDTQANVDGNYAMLDDDHARYETSSFVRKRQSDAQYSQVLPNSQPYLRPRGLLMANNEYASPLPHGPSGGPYPTLKSGGNSFAVPYALAMDADVDAGDAGQYYLTPSSAPQPDSGHPLGWVADNSLEGSPDSACQDHRPAGTSGSRLGRRHVHHGCTACHKKQNTCPGWCCFRRRLVLFVGCVLFAGTIAGGVLGLSYRKESTENEGSDKAQAVGTSTVTTSMAPATTELSSVVKVIRLEAVSASVCVGGGPRGIGYFRVYLNGTDQDATQGRGTNIVIFDSVFNVIFRGTYDTFLSTAAADALGNKLDSYPNGTVAVIGMVDEHSNAMNKKARNALHRFGCADTTFGYRESWAMIGIAGAQPGSVAEDRGGAGGNCLTPGFRPTKLISDVFLVDIV